MNNLGYDFDNTVWEMFAIIQWFSDTAKQNVAKFMLAYFFFFLFFLFLSIVNFLRSHLYNFDTGVQFITEEITRTIVNDRLSAQGSIK